IAGERVKGEKTFESRNPARPSEVIGRFQAASREQAARAIESAHAAFATWSRVPAAERAGLLIETARRMRERRHEFSAWLVFQVVTGSGGTVGDTLVRHPKTRFVSFTGSRDVGVGIHRLASEVAPGQIWLKRVVAEMGGKDAIIVDEEADLDAAAQGVAASAFGFQGQKCSACSRAIV